MKKIQFLIFWEISLFLSYSQAQESPYRLMEMECSVRHDLENWNNLHFDHNQTKFSLISQHQLLRGWDCHVLTGFINVSLNCNSCRTDVHQSKFCPRCTTCYTYHPKGTEKGLGD